MMQKTLTGLLTIFILSSFCLNSYHVNTSGQEFFDVEFLEFPIFYQSFDTTFYKKQIEYIDINIGNTEIYENESQALSDKAVALIKLGKVKEAKNILLKLYQNNPDEYHFVINLATAYELTGNVDSALILTKKALKINQDSHHGSEWFHVKVLEAKQKNIKNPTWVKRNKVLGIRLPGLEADSIIITQKMESVLWDVAYQLKERIPFTPQDDILLANIFNEYGGILSKFSMEKAYVAYEIGLKYDKNNVFGMASKKEGLLDSFKKYDFPIPDIKNYYPDRDKYYKENLKIYTKDSTQNSQQLNPISMMMIVGLCLLIAFFMYRFYKKRNN